MIMLICRWMCPESLHVYRRMGTREHERLINEASTMNVDAIQSANVVRVVGDQGYAALFADLSLNHASHSKEFEQTAGTALNEHTRQLVPTEAQPPSAPSAPKQPRTHRQPSSHVGPPAHLCQLSKSPSVNDSVVVPADLWPAYTCNELGGAGWMATVVRVHRTTALVSFDHNRTRDGRPYKPELLPLGELRVLQQ